MNINRRMARQQRRKQYKDAIKAIQPLPKPPVENGVCACGCCHVPDRGACPKYSAGLNSRCVICDHSVLCHRRKGEAPPKMWNYPIAMAPEFDHLKPPGWVNPYEECFTCHAMAMRCPTCNTGVPIKEAIKDPTTLKVYHTGTCPKCGAVSIDCPGEHKPKEENEPAKPVEDTAGTADPATAVD